MNQTKVLNTLLLFYAKTKQNCQVSTDSSEMYGKSLYKKAKIYFDLKPQMLNGN